MHPYVHCSIIYNSQVMKATCVYWHMDKEDVIYIVEYYSAIKNAIYNNMNGSRGHYAKWNKSDKRKTNTIFYHLYMESKNKTNE